MFFHRSLGRAALTTGAVLLACTAGFAETVKLGATLDAKQQSPSLDAPGKGSAALTFDTESRKLDWTIEYSDLTGMPVMGHFHGPAERGHNADVAIPFEGDLSSPIKGSATLTEEQAENLLAGKYYINLHTEAHKPGEIRGQVEKTM